MSSTGPALVLWLLTVIVAALVGVAAAAAWLLTGPVNHLLTVIGWYPTTPWEVGLGVFLGLAGGLGIYSERNQ